MLYIVNIVISLIWFIWVIKKGKYPWSAILTTYAIALWVVDVVEVFNIFILDLYKFPALLLSDFYKDNQVGVIFADAVILPLTAVIFCHYSIQSKKQWKPIILFVFMEFVLEVLYLKLGYLIYYRWSIWLSVLLYFIGISMFAKYAPRLLRQEKPVSYSLIIAATTYNAIGWFGAILGGELLNWYQWSPHIFTSPHTDDRFCAIGFNCVLAILVAVLIPKIIVKYRPIVFILICIFAISFENYAHAQGWLIYHNWNLIFAIIRWVIPFSAIIWLDQKESFRV